MVVHECYSSATATHPNIFNPGLHNVTRSGFPSNLIENPKLAMTQVSQKRIQFESANTTGNPWLLGTSGTSRVPQPARLHQRAAAKCLDPLARKSAPGHGGHHPPVDATTTVVEVTSAEGYLDRWLVSWRLSVHSCEKKAVMTEGLPNIKQISRCLVHVDLQFTNINHISTIWNRYSNWNTTY